MGGAGLRGERTERRWARVVDAAALASGEMNEDPLDDLGSLDARDDAQPAATHTTVFDVDVEHALEPLQPVRGRRGRMAFAGCWTSTVGDDVVAVFEVRGEHAVVSGEVGAGARIKCRWPRCSRYHRANDNSIQTDEYPSDYRPVTSCYLRRTCY